MRPGKIDARKPVPKLLQYFFDKVFADKGYISLKLAKDVVDSVGLQLVTKLKRNIKQRLMLLGDRINLSIARARPQLIL